LVAFAIFAKAAWGMSRFYAYRLIEAGKTVAESATHLASRLARS
jgi:hypothetical protein